MSALTPTQKRLLSEAAKAGKRGLMRDRRGYAASLSSEAFTIRTVRAAEREGLVLLQGVCGDTLRITQRGRNLLDAEGRV